MLTIDLKKSLKPYLSPAVDKPQLVDVPDMQFLMVDGRGNPNTAPLYGQALSALYTLAYTLKFAFKLGPKQVDFPVMASEGLWWAEDMSSFLEGDKDRWEWTMMIMLPEVVSAADVEESRAAALKKKGKEASPLLGAVRLERFHEGLSAQVMHIGPYSAEAPTIQRLHAFIAEKGYARRGKHHEIYLGDPNRTAPDKLRTIVRQPVK